MTRILQRQRGTGWLREWGASISAILSGGRRVIAPIWLSMWVLLGSLPALAQVDLRLTATYSGLNEPVFLTHAGDGSGRVFIVERKGVIKIGRNGTVLATPFLDIRDRVASEESEQGLLGLAFDPEYESNGRFYVNFTRLGSGDTQISRFQVSTDANLARADSEQVMLGFGQPFPNHNGGWMGFGPDGFLYVASGDGGSGGDPFGNGQNLNTLLGKILRLDVSGNTAQPAAGNPFLNQANRLPQIWAYGLRNPWRMSFDRQTGDLWIGDVGQDRAEEINFQAAGSTGGQNYGWKLAEGTCTNNCAGLTQPVLSIAHTSQPCDSVTGGYVYRGTAYPRLQGLYIFGDYCRGYIDALSRSGNSFTRQSLRPNQSAGFNASFGEDEVGNLYLIDARGTVFLLSDGPPQSLNVITPAYTGTWINNSQPGHGLIVEILTDNRILAWWFTYQPNGGQAWFGGIGTYSGNVATIQVIKAEGGRFLPNFDPSTISNPVLGTMELRFDSCTNGVVNYQFGQGYGSGSWPINRLTVAAGLSCSD